MKYAAFMRALNVGGRTVKMDALRRIFADLGFKNVESFIASGNIVFDSPSKAAGALERKIAGALEDSLGYQVATFLRTTGQLAEIAEYVPFRGVTDGRTYVVGFLATALSAESTRKLMALESAHDRFHVREKEFWWYSDLGQGESKLSNVVLERTLGVRTTLRNVRTVRKMAARWGPSR